MSKFTGCKIRGLDRFFEKSFYWKTIFFTGRLFFWRRNRNQNGLGSIFPFWNRKLNLKTQSYDFDVFSVKKCHFFWPKTRFYSKNKVFLHLSCHPANSLWPAPIPFFVGFCDCGLVAQHVLSFPKNSSISPIPTTFAKHVLRHQVSLL